MRKNYKNNFSLKAILILYVVSSFLISCDSVDDKIETTTVYFIQKSLPRGSPLYQSTLNSGQELVLVPNIRLTNFHYFSPNGEFVAYIENGKLNVFKLGTQELITSIDSGHKPSFMKPHQRITWSPNNEMLAFSRFLLVEEERTRNEILIYDIQSQEWIIINDNNDLKATPVFLPDLQRLIYSKIRICGTNPFMCDEEEQLWELESINFRTKNIVGSYPLNPDEYSIKFGVESSLLCNLKSGQNNAHVAFASFCITDGILVFKEAFVLDSISGEIVQLTQFGDIDFSNSFSYSWTADNQYFVLGYNHNYIFGNNLDQSGFITYKAGEYDKPVFQTDVENLLLETEWSPDGNYVISVMGPDFATYENSFVGQIDEIGQVIKLSDALPIISLNGCWTENGYISQIDDQIILLQLPELEIVELNIRLDGDFEIISCFSSS